MRRIAVFVDGSNLFFIQKDSLNWWIDPKRLLNWIARRGEIVDATYYASIDSTNEAQQKYLKAVCHMGYRVETKAIRSQSTSDGSQRHKANLDIDIVVDMINTINCYDEAVLVSGDADFCRALQCLRTRGKLFVVVSTKGFVATELRALAGMHYFDLADLREQIEKK